MCFWHRRLRLNGSGQGRLIEHADELICNGRLLFANKFCFTEAAATKGLVQLCLTWFLKQFVPVLLVRLLLNCYLSRIPWSFEEFSSLHIVHGSYLTFIAVVLIIILLDVRGVLTTRLINHENFYSLVFQWILAVLFQNRNGWLERDGALFSVMIHIDIVFKLQHQVFWYCQPLKGLLCWSKGLLQIICVSRLELLIQIARRAGRRSWRVDEMLVLGCFKLFSEFFQHKLHRKLDREVG